MLRHCDVPQWDELNRSIRVVRRRQTYRHEGVCRQPNRNIWILYLAVYVLGSNFNLKIASKKSSRPWHHFHLNLDAQFAAFLATSPLSNSMKPCVHGVFSCSSRVDGSMMPPLACTKVPYQSLRASGTCSRKATHADSMFQKLFSRTYRTIRCRYFRCSWCISSADFSYTEHTAFLTTRTVSWTAHSTLVWRKY